MVNLPIAYSTKFQPGNFGKFGETNIIHQYFDQQISIFTKAANVEHLCYCKLPCQNFETINLPKFNSTRILCYTAVMINPCEIISTTSLSSTLHTCMVASYCVYILWECIISCMLLIMFFSCKFLYSSSCCCCCVGCFIRTCFVIHYLQPEELVRDYYVSAIHGSQLINQITSFYINATIDPSILAQFALMWIIIVTLYNIRRKEVWMVSFTDSR